MGFSNTNKGKLLIGVKDSGKIVGLKDPEGESEYIIGVIERGTKPKVDYQIELIEVSKDRAVIIINIEEGEKKPYGVIIDGKKWPTVFKRSNDETLELGPVERSSLSLSASIKKGKLKFSEKEQEILNQIEIGVSTLKELQKKLKFSRGYLVRQLALFHSRGLIGIHTSPRKEVFFTLPQIKN